VRSLSWPVSGSPPPSPTSSPSSTKPITTSTPTPTGGHCSGVAAWSSGVAYTGGQEATYGKPRFINSVMHSSYFAPLRCVACGVQNSWSTGTNLSRRPTLLAVPPASGPTTAPAKSFRFPRCSSLSRWCTTGNDDAHMCMLCLINAMVSESATFDGLKVSSPLRILPVLGQQRA
jgi:hypothetical protein